MNRIQPLLYFVVLLAFQTGARSEPGSSANASVRLENGSLAVLLDPAFPRAIQYLEKTTAGKLDGQQSPVSTVELNGKPATCRITVFVTPDLNSDGKADWQDAALVYRRTMPMPYGHESRISDIFIWTPTGKTAGPRRGSRRNSPP